MTLTRPRPTLKIILAVIGLGRQRYTSQSEAPETPPITLFIRSTHSYVYNYGYIVMRYNLLAGLSKSRLICSRSAGSARGQRDLVIEGNALTQQEPGNL